MKTLVRSKRKKSVKTYKASWNGVPATVRPSLFEKSLFENFFASIAWHIIGLLLIWLIVFSLNYFGITAKILPKPKEKTRDIEFSLEGRTHHRSNHHKAVSEHSAETSQNIVAPQQTKTSKVAKSKTQNNLVPEFSMPMPNLKSMSSGLGGASKSKGRSSSGGSSSNSPISDIDNAFSFGKGNSGTGTSSSGFDKNAARKVIASYDISPYVNELKRDIRQNWTAPRNYDKRVELFLRIAKDGRLVILNVKRTSEVGEVDNAALNAVKKCLPLDPLPSKYPKGYLDVVFTFNSGSNYVVSRF